MSEQQTAVNWREMEAGTELDRIVAEALGWRIELVDEDRYNKWYRVLDATGADVMRHTAYSTKNYHPDYDLDCVIPEYSTDLNAAWKLFDDLPHELTPRLVRILEPRGDHMATVHKAMILHNETHEQWEGSADEPAHAICRAWLAWKETL